MKRDDERHGTYAGYVTHRREGKTPCAKCKKAHADYMREWRKKNPRYKETGQVTTRALWRLADRYRDEYEALYAEEQARLRVRKMKGSAA